jgi:hypothetical protein
MSMSAIAAIVGFLCLIAPMADFFCTADLDEFGHERENALHWWLANMHFKKRLLLGLLSLSGLFLVTAAACFP